MQIYGKLNVLSNAFSKQFVNLNPKKLKCMYGPLNPVVHVIWLSLHCKYIKSIRIKSTKDQVWEYI